MKKRGNRLMEKISIVVPIYNVERYLGRCIESLIKQTYTNLEIILVNDGSKDNSLSICKGYAKKDTRIVVIDKVNEGVSVARNTGIEAATGSYIGFIDPDDYIEPTMYECLYTHIKEQDCPVCLCDFYKDTKKRSIPQRFEFKEAVLEDSEIVDKIINHMVGMSDLISRCVWIMGCVWRGLFKKSFLDEYELRFVAGITIMEDLVFMIQTLLKCHKVAICHETLYHYVQNPTSALHTYNKRFWEDQIMVYDLLEKALINDANLDESMRSRLDIRYIGMVLSAIKNEAYMNKEADFKTAMIHIKTICQDENLRFVLERIKPIQVAERSKEVAKKRATKKAVKKQPKGVKPLRRKKKVETTGKRKKDKVQAKKKAVRMQKKGSKPRESKFFKRQVADES